MNPYELLKIPYFLLGSDWKEDGVEHGRISYMLTSNNGEEDHNKHVEEQKSRLINENDGDYSSWRFTDQKHKNLGGAVGHVTVMHFRIRDAY